MYHGTDFFQVGMTVHLQNYFVLALIPVTSQVNDIDEYGFMVLHAQNAACFTCALSQVEAQQPWKPRQLSLWQQALVPS